MGKNGRSGTRRDNGEGCIYYDEKRKKWNAQVRWTDKDGTMRTKKFSGQKQAVVKNKLNEFKKQLLISDGSSKASSNILFQDYAEHWLREVLASSLKPTSFDRKEGTLKYQVYPIIGNIPIDSISHSDVQNMVNELRDQGYSYSTIKKAYEAVNGCLREYRKLGTVSYNPCEGVILPTNKQKSVANVQFFREEQCSLIIKEATRKYNNGTSVYRLGDAIIVLLYTGLRIGELIALTWDDIDFENKTINIDKNAVVAKTRSDEGVRYKLQTQKSTKTESGRRIIPMSTMAYDAINRIRDITGDTPYVLSSKNGNQISPRNINRMFHSILIQTKICSKDSGLYGVHTLRHTFASMLFRNGCDVKIVSELLGHSDTKITENIYIHVIQEQKVKAIRDIDRYSTFPS